MAAEGHRSEPTSVIVTQLPKEAYRRPINDYFGQIGPVVRSHLVRDDEGNSKGIAYIVYSTQEDAERCVEQLNNSKFQDKVIHVKLTKQKGGRKIHEEEDESPEVKEEANDFYEEEQENKYNNRGNAAKDRNMRKQGRIVVRNLSFKVDEDIVREHFSKFGVIDEINLLRKKDGQLVGCGFVQYRSKSEAQRAIEECNMKPLLGRTIAVDIAVPKEKFTGKNERAESSHTGYGDDRGNSAAGPNERFYYKDEQKRNNHVIFGEEDTDYLNVKIKEERLSDDEEMSIVKERRSHADDSKEDIKVKREDMLDNEGDDSGVADDEIVSEDEEEFRGSQVRDPMERPKPAPTKGPSKDVAEERTLFIRNVSFDAREEDISRVLEKFGELKYVLICMDKMTDHPKGTAFAQFKEREAANACLAAVTDPLKKEEFLVCGRYMHAMRAISRNDLDVKTKEKKEKIQKDKRNLYLAREGFIREGTQAAADVSKTDLALRVRLTQVKKRLLKNLHMFISPNRLCVNNLPEKLTDNEFKQIFVQNSPKGAKITEARIMKDLRTLSDDGTPVSKGYGFISFAEHEHALQALRKVNNNPDVFTVFKRPIVEFSVENRAILNAREKRMEKSREMNPTWKNSKKAQKKNAEGKKKGGKKTGDKAKPAVAKKASKVPTDAEGAQLPGFVGTKSNVKQGTSGAIMGNLGPKVRNRDKGQPQGKITRRKYRRELQDRASGKKRKRPQVDAPEEAAAPIKKAKTNTEGKEGKMKKLKMKKKMNKEMKSAMREDASFNKMVARYKQKMSSVGPKVPTKRWYED
ncbi:RNA-binding protein 28-like [Penaeus chinensis]|uniref:RNA-binding protein 28-like n=1 Tax=Penaeus chinensis TaxID=139456 RepID=UPI001FB7D185|nr:RNA-binding protein 28-like [Penaeus chinensis]